MRQNKPFHAKKRISTINKNIIKRKAVKGQNVFKASSWYEKAALSIKAAPSRAYPLKAECGRDASFHTDR